MFAREKPFATCLSFIAGTGAHTISGFHMHVITDLNKYNFLRRPTNSVIVLPEQIRPFVDKLPAVLCV